MTGETVSVSRMGEHEGPLQRAAKDMHDIYANEIARLIAAGEKPSDELVRSWERYAAETRDVRMLRPRDAAGE